MRCIAVANQKGGVGKTTVTIGLAAAAAAAGSRVLVVDLDPQGHATVALGHSDAYLTGGSLLAHALTATLNTPLDAAVILDAGMPPFDGRGRVDLVPSGPGMFLVESKLTARRGRELRLAAALECTGPLWDLVLIDCPPSLGVLTDNAFYAALDVLIVAAAEPASVHGLGLLVSQIESLNTALGVDVNIAGIAANRVENTRVANDVLGAYHDAGIPLVGVIPKRVRLQEAWSLGRVPQSLDNDGDITAAFADLAGNLELDELVP